jgi:hypothetical protein
VGIDHQLDLRSHRLPHRAHLLHAGLDPPLAGEDRHGPPRGHLEGSEASGNEFDRRAGHLLWCLAAWPIGVGADAIAHRTAEQAVNRDAQRLPLDIPEGNLDSGKRAEERWSAMPEGMPVGLLPEMLDAGRIGSQQQRFEVLDRPQDGVGLSSERGLAEPGQPIVCVDEDEDVVAPTRADRHCADGSDPA